MNGWLPFVVIVVVYLALMGWLLPRLGVPT
jgi:hypothetical protein